MRINKSLKIFLFSLALGALILGANGNLVAPAVLDAPAAQAAGSNVLGRILLQVQDKGQAWYVSPLDGDRYYLGRPADAFSVMRNLGLGVSNRDLAGFLANGAPANLSGRILLQVQDKGQAYYIYPVNRHLYYLGTPADAFSVMRNLGLGITNADLATITIAPASAPELTVASVFSFKYQNQSYQLTANLSSTLYSAYAASPKVYTYDANNPPLDPRNNFYGMFLKLRSGDTSLANLVSQLRSTAALNGWTDDQLAEYTLAFVQYIPYDSAKLKTDPSRNSDPYYPYETLYLDRGVCSDKTFLAVDLLRQLGFGAAILDFPDINHSAVGIQCPVADSVNGSGYCYAETTNYFPLGVIPQTISGQALISTNEFTNLFSSQILGKIEIYQATTGKVYGGVSQTKIRVADLAAQQNSLNTQKTSLDSQNAALSTQETNLNTMKAQMDAYQANGQNSQYNAMVPTYNNLVSQYNSALAAYQTQSIAYNQAVAVFNQAMNSFYQL